MTLLLALAGLVAKAQTVTPDTATVNFVTQAAKGGKTEVNAGKLAVNKSTRVDIKAFGAKMITDHSKANAELMGIVSTKRWEITPPTAAEVAPDAMLTQSTKADFDKNYVTMMVQDHKKTVALFEYAAANAPDPSIKAFAVKTLPKLKQHLTNIQAIATKMGIAY